MTAPRYQRRKEDRPREISEAAFEVFAEKGYAAARVDEVAKRAGVSKGLLYLYFDTKEELFKAVIKRVVTRRIDALLLALEETDLSSEEFVRGPLLEFMKQIPGSPVAVVIRLLIAEGHRHPDLVSYYWENVVSRGLAAISRFIERGVERGEFRDTAVTGLPQLVLSPMMLSMIWRILFTTRELDTDRLMETQIEMILAYIKA
ncbi:MAG: TetR/AcrR family transcriptional regulator [Gammaproteobacteria bacterium]|nr:TetR/AcrR family transcriptional regulator [Gammaproteobacteria bacterium]MDH3364377.1 TetR/AcrR family transcriptional regulator [Gammaproteobacteria bacterium]MDH3481973.1 TetR/AcrR family transcriptional regulator [Gammaproteobacteria bacterium]